MARRSGDSHGAALGAGSLIWAVASTAHAQSLKLPSIQGIPSVFQNLDSAFGLIWNTVVGVAGVAFMGLLLYGGFLYLTSAGNDTVADRAKHTIRDAVIGIALVILAWPIGALVLNFFLKDNPTANPVTSPLQLPTATSTTPLNPSTGTSTTGTVPNASNTTTTGQQQTTATVPNAMPNTTLVVKQPGQPTQTLPVGQTGQVNYTLDPSFTYAETDLVFLQNKSGVGQPVGGDRIRVFQQAIAANDEPMYEATVGDNGHLTLKLPVGEQIRITLAATGHELIRDQTVSAGVGNQIQVFVPSF